MASKRGHATGIVPAGQERGSGWKPSDSSMASSPCPAVKEIWIKTSLGEKEEKTAPERAKAMPAPSKELSESICGEL